MQADQSEVVERVVAEAVRRGKRRLRRRRAASLVVVLVLVMAGAESFVLASSGGDHRNVSSGVDHRNRLTTAPAFLGEAISGLDAISCPARDDCFAVGSGNYKPYASSQDFPFAERWNGARWSLVPIPYPKGVNEDLNALSCSSAQQCVAVGDWYVSGSTYPLAEVWDGVSWRRVTVPGTGQELTGVSCPAPNDCFAVGGELWGPAPSLVDHWNGRTWQAEHLDLPKGVYDALGVQCPTATSCYVAGEITRELKGPNGEVEPIVSTLSDGRWHTEAISPPGWQPNFPGAMIYVGAWMSCFSARTCEIVWQYHIGAGPGADMVGLLAEGRWSLQKWNLESPIFEGVSCVSHRDCIAVGDPPMPFGYPTWRSIAAWDGYRWVSVSSPDVGLSGVLCWSSRDCVAVGVTPWSGRIATERSIVEFWNGRRWVLERVPQP